MREWEELRWKPSGRTEMSNGQLAANDSCNGYERDGVGAL